MELKFLIAEQTTNRPGKHVKMKWGQFKDNRIENFINNNIFFLLHFGYLYYYTARQLSSGHVKLPVVDTLFLNDIQVEEEDPSTKFKCAPFLSWPFSDSFLLLLHYYYYYYYTPKSTTIIHGTTMEYRISPPFLFRLTFKKINFREIEKKCRTCHHFQPLSLYFVNNNKKGIFFFFFLVILFGAAWLEDIFWGEQIIGSNFQ